MWVSIVAIAIALRWTVFLGVAREQRFGLPIIYMLGTWLPIIVLNVIEGGRLMQYLKMHHHQKWEELTYIPGFGPDTRASFKTSS